MAGKGTLLFFAQDSGGLGVLNEGHLIGTMGNAKLCLGLELYFKLKFSESLVYLV